jgi:hypothetical protein
VYVREVVGCSHEASHTNLFPALHLSSNQTSDTSFKSQLLLLPKTKKRRKQTQPKIQPIYKGGLVSENNNRNHSTHNTETYKHPTKHLNTKGPNHEMPQMPKRRFPTFQMPTLWKLFLLGTSFARKPRLPKN